MAFGWSMGRHKHTGYIGPFKTRRYFRIRHWLQTGGGDKYDDNDSLDGVHSEWLKWNELPKESRQSEWFCWQLPGETIFQGLSLQKFVDAHVKNKN